MGEEELKVLLDAAAACKLDPSGLKAQNPFTMKGETAKALQIAVQTNHPQMAAKWRVDAGENSSLEAAAVKAGLREMSQSVHQELMDLDSDYVRGVEESKAAWEAKMLSQFEEKTQEAQDLREKQQAQFQRQSGNNQAGGGYNRDFIRRFGNSQQQQRTPARRVVGQ